MLAGGGRLASISDVSLGDNPGSGWGSEREEPTAAISLSVVNEVGFTNGGGRESPECYSLPLFSKTPQATTRKNLIEPKTLCAKSRVALGCLLPSVMA